MSTTREQRKDTEERHKQRAKDMENMYVELWNQGIGSGLIITKIANKYYLSGNRVSEILRPIKLRKRLNLK
jgi:hypothetical protein